MPGQCTSSRIRMGVPRVPRSEVTPIPGQCALSRIRMAAVAVGWSLASFTRLWAPLFVEERAVDSHSKSREVPSSPPLPVRGKGFTLVVSRNGQFPAFARFGAKESHS